MRKYLFAEIAPMCDSLLCFVFILAAFAIHLWTFIIAIDLRGILGGILFLPVIAQMYWFFVMARVTGTLGNPFSLAIIAFFSASILLIGAAVATGVLTKEDRILKV